MKPYLLTRREGRERVDEADVRAFRRLDRADSSVMRRMDVADLEARTLPREAARAERRQAALVGDLGQGIGLVHELRKLRRAEELAHGGGGRLGVDEILRHDGIDIDRRHPLLDRALHAQEPETYWFSMSSPTERTRRLPRWSMSSISPRPSRDRRARA